MLSVFLVTHSHQHLPSQKCVWCGWNFMDQIISTRGLWVLISGWPLLFLGDLFPKSFLQLIPNTNSSPDGSNHTKGKVPWPQKPPWESHAPGGWSPQRTLYPGTHPLLRSISPGQIRGVWRWGVRGGVLSTRDSFSGDTRSCREHKPPPLRLLLAWRRDSLM